MPTKIKTKKPLKAKAYKPTEKEKYMNAKMLAYFKQKLLTWKDELLSGADATISELKEESEVVEIEDADKASEESNRALELRIRDRERKLINKIDKALARIEDGSYGYCEVTGNPIGIKRLQTHPVVSMTTEAQEEHERKEKLFKTD